MNARSLVMLFGIGALLALGGAALLWRNLPAGPGPAGTPPAATRINDDRPLPPFRLKKQGGTFGNADLQGKWTLAFFGYTFCPDACPTAMTLLKEVQLRLVATGTPPPQVLMVSVDPARDTPEVVARYVAAFDPQFVAAVGDDAALAPLVKHLGVMYARHDQDKSPNYTVDHSVGIYLIDPQGRLKAVFTPPQDVERMAADYGALIR